MEIVFTFLINYVDEIVSLDSLSRHMGAWLNSTILVINFYYLFCPSPTPTPAFSYSTRPYFISPCPLEYVDKDLFQNSFNVGYK